MTSKKTTRRALFSSFMALLLCCSMLVGTTFAWFTDSVTSAGNIIKSGTLDVTMEWKDATDTGAQQTYKDASEGPIFNYDKWEPGYVEAKNIKISNVGTLALKYQLGIKATDEVSKLTDAIDVYFAEGEMTLANRAMSGLTKVGTLTQILAGMPSNASGDLNEAESDTVTIALKMREEAGNEYQNLSVGAAFSVVLYATQLEAETDSFGTDYDKDAYNYYVNDVAQLSSALAQGGAIAVVGTMDPEETTVASEWGTTPMELYVDAGKVDTLTGGEYVLDEAAKYGVVVAAVDGQSVTLSDMDITADSRWSVTLDNYGENIVLEDVTVNATSGAGIWAYGSDSVTTLNNVTVDQKGLSEANASTAWADTAVAVSNGQTLVINGGSYTGNKWAVYGYNSGSNVTINGGTFKAPTVIQMDGVWSGSATSVATINDGSFDGTIYLDWGTNAPEIYINGGTFNNFSATVYGAAKLVIKGGTFDDDPSAYVADGYAVTANADGTYSVGEKIAYVASAAELTTALTDGGKIALTDDVVMGSDTVTIAEDTVINLNGYNLDATANASRPFTVDGGANLTINADGADVECGAYGLVTMTEGTLTINGGNFSSETGNNGSFIRVSGDEEMVINLNNVTYKAETTDSGVIRTSGSNVTVNVVGGTYEAGMGILLENGSITGAAITATNIANMWPAVYADGDVTVSGCTIKSACHAVAVGGGNTVKVENCDVQAADGKLAFQVFSSGGTIEVVDCTYTGEYGTTGRITSGSPDAVIIIDGTEVYRKSAS